MPSAGRRHPRARRGFARQAGGSLPIAQLPDGPPWGCTRQPGRRARGSSTSPQYSPQPASGTVSHLHDSEIFVPQQRLERSHGLFTRKLSFVMSQLVAVVTETQN